jgi:threonine synthase
VTVTDHEAIGARAALAAQGLYVEPTAAACAAGARWLTDDDGEVVVPLCGAGLMAP